MRLAGLTLASSLPPVLSDPVMPQAVSEAWGGAAEEMPPEPSALCSLRACGQGSNCQLLKDIKRGEGKPSSLQDRLYEVLTAC